MTYDDRRADVELGVCSKCGGHWWITKGRPKPFVCRECERKQP